MFASRYQGGTLVEVADVTGSQPLAAWKFSHIGAARRVYERDVKGYVHVIDSGPHTSLQLPKHSHQKLSLEQPFLVIQIKLPSAPILCTIEIYVIDSSDTRRRLLFSTSNSSPVATPSQARLPVPEHSVPRRQWLNLCIDMSSLTVACFQNDFRSLEGIILRPNCSIRKIFTLRCPPSDIEIAVSEQHNSPYSIFAPIPKTVDFPSGVSHVTQILNWDVVAPAAPTPRKKIVIARPPLRSPNMKSVIKRSRRLSEAHSLSREGTGLALTTRSKSKTPSKPIARRRLTISPNINRVLPPTRTQRAVRSSEMPLFHQKSSSLQTSSEECIRKIAPCAKIEEEDENVPPPSQEFNIQKPASTDAVSNASQLDCLETQVGVKEIWERQNDREIENREETDMDGDTDLDLVLMGELSEEGALNREEAVANTCKPDINDWNTDEDELDFVQDALKYYDAESRRTASLSRSSSARASVESGKSFLEPNEVCASTESAFNVLRQQLRPVRLSRNGKARSESSSRCSSTSTSSARAAMAATLPLSETHENRSVKQQFMFDPILKLYFDPSTNKYFEMR